GNPYGPPPGPGYGPGGPRPPYPPPGFGPPPRKRNIWPVVIGVGMFLFLIIFAFAFIVGSAITGGSSSSSGGSGFFSDRIAVLEINGVLAETPGYYGSTDNMIRLVKEWQDTSRIKGIVVRVNSPGGAVSATQELLDALDNYKRETGNPVVISMGD